MKLTISKTGLIEISQSYFLHYESVNGYSDFGPSTSILLQVNIQREKLNMLNIFIAYRFWMRMDWIQSYLDQRR